ncbi:NAD(P)-dependent oxidoreductase [Paenibacillus sp. P26]|nr:NAD(P)-dependent oxidoreductase [Paenibacillus sp. P26]
MILITGGLGFIGTHTARALLDQGVACVLTRHRSLQVPGFLQDELGKRLFIEPLELTDPLSFREIGKRHNIKGIVHLAMAAPGSSDAINTVRAHTLSLLQVLQSAVDWGVSRVSIASAIGVYSGISETPPREDMPLPMTADNPFTTLKKCSELISTFIAGRAGLEVVHLRISGIWGPLHEANSNLVIAPKLVHAAVRGGSPDFTGPHASPVLDAYDMCYVKDAARAIALLQTAPKLNHSTYNVGCGRPVTNREFVSAIHRHLPDARIDCPAGLPLNLALDITRIREDTGFVPEYDVERGVAEYIGWLRAGNDR